MINLRCGQRRLVNNVDNSRQYLRALIVIAYEPHSRNPYILRDKGSTSTYKECVYLVHYIRCLFNYYA